MTELNVEHVLLFVIVAFLLYHLMGRCGCSGMRGGNGFRVGGELKCKDYPVGACGGSCKWTDDKCMDPPERAEHCNKWGYPIQCKEAGCTWDPLDFELKKHTFPCI
jgi:hypothetical protein